jgi:hypothetical protein
MYSEATPKRTSSGRRSFKTDGNWLKTSAFRPAASGSSKSSRRFLRFGGDEPRVRGRLAKAKERFEHVQLRRAEAVPFDALHDVGLRAAEDLFVDALLFGRELAVDDLLDLLGQILRHLLLRPPKDERPNHAGEREPRPIVAREAPELVLLPEHAGV